jgi:hypothetical protein
VADYRPVDARFRVRATIYPEHFARISRAVDQGKTPYFGLWLRSIVSVLAVVPTYAGRVRQDSRYFNLGHPTLSPLHLPAGFRGFNA